ncbi:uncharacterized protein A4U43_C04F16460 [Asparagus officinalis]|uniref:Uncharacterized protein n=1 Tax=Asparagus officinalis TaxID=4686 RepID=A0A5P1F1D3_ASPOF|nr:uncharacterized protein A4U43_C04F16460 [Asparagus officinalis]
MNAVAEISRGHPKPTVKPIWLRESIPNPQKFIIPKSAYNAALTSSTNNLKQHIIDISSDQINKLKNNFIEETDENCSTFDILTALLWRVRTRAVNGEPRANVTLTFPTDMRPNLNQVLPCGSGYYGNLLYASLVKSTSEFVGQAAFAEVVKTVRDAKQRSFKKCSTWSSQGFDEELVTG